MILTSNVARASKTLRPPTLRALAQKAGRALHEVVQKDLQRAAERGVGLEKPCQHGGTASSGMPELQSQSQKNAANDPKHDLHNVEVQVVYPHIHAYLHGQNVCLYMCVTTVCVYMEFDAKRRRGRWREKDRARETETENGREAPPQGPRSASLLLAAFSWPNVQH